MMPVLGFITYGSLIMSREVNYFKHEMKTLVNHLQDKILSQ